jgi:beta-barrel assembly-enhancing protease
MIIRFNRSLVSILLSTLLSTGAMAVPTQQQAKKADDKKTAKSEAKPETKTVAAKTDPRKPLSVNEDPAMIGKRNINKGIIGKLSGSMEKDVAIGRQLATEIDKQSKFIDDPLITEYINRVGQNVVLHSDAKIPFTIKVVDSDEVNAFALPGGFFYVNKGLILAADNEAEIAGVMAHEIAHVAARHSIENQTKGSILEWGAIAGSIFLGGVPGMIFNNTAGLGLLASYMKFSRGAEEEADRLGVQYLYAAGYDPHAMGTMFEKLSAKNKKKPGFISKAFSTHPQSLDRLQTSKALVERFPEKDEYVITTSEFQRLKSRLARLTNTRASGSGTDLSTGTDGSTPGRPTLKRRQPPPEDSSSGTSTDPGTPSSGSSDQERSDSEGPPKLKRNAPKEQEEQQGSRP